MRLNSLKAIVKTALRGAAVLLLGAGVAPAQQTINLSAGPTTATLPDGTAVPMWGYTCGAVASTATATCAALNPAAGTGWSPVVITVPDHQPHQQSHLWRQQDPNFAHHCRPVGRRSGHHGDQHAKS
jgi:hypothetical protein